MWYWLVKNQYKHEQNFQNVCWSYWEKRPGSCGKSTPYIPLRDQLKSAETAFIETQIRQKKSNSNFRGKQIKTVCSCFVMRLRTLRPWCWLQLAVAVPVTHQVTDVHLTSLELCHYGIPMRAFVQLSIGPFWLIWVVPMRKG